MNRELLKNEVAQFLLDDTNGLSRPDADVNLFETGYFDSLKIVNLVVFVEEKFQLNLDYDDLTEENLATLNKIADLIERKSVSDGRPLA